MRIAIFSEVFLPKIDGITNRLAHTIRCLVEAGDEVLVFAPDSAQDEHAGARVVRIPGLPFAPYPDLRVSLPHPRITWELLRFRPDVVHAVGPACLGVWGVIAARSLRLPLVASYHTDLPAYMPEHGLGWAQGAAWPLIRAVHGAADVNLCPSRFTCDQLDEHGIPGARTWMGGVDTEMFHPSRRSLGMRQRLSDGHPDEPLLLYAGRLSHEKNLASLATVLDKLPGARLALVGDGPARADLEALMAERRVVFTGFLRGLELGVAFASADAFVMPSLTETLGFVTLEAMASGTPVVAARAGGTLHLVRDGHNGLLYDPEQPEAAAELLRQVLTDRTRGTLLARRARAFAEASDWRAATATLRREYQCARTLRAQPGLAGRVWDSLRTALGA